MTHSNPYGLAPVPRRRADPQPQHYAFVVDDGAVDAAYPRIVTAGIDYHPDPGGRQSSRFCRRPSHQTKLSH